VGVRVLVALGGNGVSVGVMVGVAVAVNVGGRSVAVGVLRCWRLRLPHSL
jgi:hypothetical protein